MSIFIPPSITSSNLKALKLELGEICFNKDDNNFYSGNGLSGGHVIGGKIISDILASANKNDETISLNTTNIATLTSNFNNLNTSLNEANTNIETNKTNISTLSSNLNEAKGKINSLDSKITNLTGTIKFGEIFENKEAFTNFKNPVNGTIYLVAHTNKKNNNLYEEYIYIKNKNSEGHFELLGTINGSDLAKISEDISYLSSILTNFTPSGDTSLSSKFNLIDSSLNEKANITDLTIYAKTEDLNNYLTNSNAESLYLKKIEFNASLNTELSNYVKNIDLSRIC